MTKTRVGIFGYGNLGRGVELACRQNDDMELVALFTRRDPATVKPLTEGVPVFAADEMASHRDNIDVLVYRRQRERPAGADAAHRTSVVDVRYPCEHPAHFAQRMRLRRRAAMWPSSRRAGIQACSPSLIMPPLPACCLRARTTFWGRSLAGLQRRHSSHRGRGRCAVHCARRLGARSRATARSQLTTRQKHTRECFVVAEEGADSCEKASSRCRTTSPTMTPR